MKRKFILLAMMLLTLIGGVKFNVLNAQETITIGSIDPNYKNNYLPFCTYNYAAISQQIYTFDQIGQSGTINAISFHRFSGGITNARLIDIYMINTSKDSFAGTTDWVSLSDSDMVYSGDLANSSGEGLITFVLNTPFEYTGENLLICINVRHNGQWTNNNYFAVFNTDETRALYKAEDISSSYNPSNMSGVSALNKLNYIELNITPAVTDDIIPAVPTGLTATAIDHKSISLTWTAGDEYALKYNIYQNGTKIGSTSETSYTVEGLTAETDYCFTVEAVRGVNVSETKSNEACATTLEYNDPLVGKQFRLRALTYIKKDDPYYYGPYDFSEAKYLHIENNNAAGLKVIDKVDSNAQRFTFEPTGNVEGQYYLRSADGYYINCGTWDVSAYDESQKSPIEVVYLDDTQTQFYLTNGTGRHFKVETGYYDNVNYKPFCDAIQQYAAKWIVEEVELQAIATVTDEEIYDDQTTTLSVTAFDGSGYTYSWSPANGLSDATSANPTFTPATTGEHTFTCTVTDTESGSTAEASVTVYVNARPALQLVVSADKEFIYNDDETAVLTATVAEGTGYAPYTYSWTLNETEDGTEATYTFFNTTVGEYTLTCTVTDARGNTQTVSKTIEVKDASERPITRKVVFVLKEQNYQDSWDSGYLQVTAEDGTDEKMILESGLAEKSYTFEIAVGSTVYVDFYIGQWGYSGSDKDSYTIMYEDGTLIYDSSIELTSTTRYTHYYYEFTVERPAPKNLVANPSQIYPDQTTTISWEAYGGAASYNIYVNGELEANTTEIPYELSGLTYNVNGNIIEVIAVDENGTEISGKASVTVQVAGTFTLTVNVTDGTNPIEGATVNIDMAYACDEFKNQVSSVTVEPTGDDGKTTVELPILCQETYFYNNNGTYVYTSYYTVEVSKSPYQDNNWNYINYNDDVTSGYTLNVVLDLPMVDYIQVQDEEGNDLYGYVMEGTNVVLSWDELEGATAYNVYKLLAGEVESSETVEETTYTIESIEKGYQYAVSALFGELESAKNYANIDVKGNGYFKGYVTDGTNALEGIQVKVSSEYGVSAVAITDAEGYFNGEIVEGDNYILTISHSDYEEFTSETFAIGYEAEYDFETITLTAKPSASDITVVTATPNDENVDVEWTVNETSTYTKYNVYRRLAGTQGKGDNIAQNVEATSTTDAAWETLEPGTYQYGVAGFVEGGTEMGVQLSENFDDGVVPEGWINTNLVSPADLWLVNQGRLYSQWTGNYYLTISQVISTSGATMTFKYMNPQYNAASRSEIHVYYSTSLDGELNEIATYSYTSAYNLQETSIDLSVISEEEIYITIANINTGEGGNGAYIDDIVITGEVTSETETQIVWSNDVVKQGPNTFEGTVSTEWNVAENWSNGVVPATGDEVIVNAEAVISGNVELSTLDIVGNGSVTVDANASLTVTGAITQEKDYSLIMNDGAQVFQNNNANVTAQFNMNLVNPSDWSTSNKDGWQFISSPLSNVNVTNIAEGNYDLYKYDGEKEYEWVNHKDVNFADNTYQHHIGYLASHETKTTLEFKGTLNYNDYNGSYAFYDFVEYYENEPLKNFYLIGNPYPFNISWADFKNNEGMANGYAYVKEDGNYGYATSGEIAVGDGFFVQAISGTPDDQYSTFYYYLKGSGNTRSTKESNNSLNITATGNAGEDNVIINFAGKSEGFDKLQNFNDAIATVYVAEGGKNYGIYNCDADVQEVELSFNANKMGNYTISIEPNGKFQTVTLVDRFTGVETNMLVEDYNFTAMSEENPNRFIVRFANGQQTTDNSHFVYQSGEELILNIQGEVQIVDVLGRVVYSGEAMNDINRINVSSFNSGAYMVKVMNGNEVKVEKVVIY